MMRVMATMGGALQQMAERFAAAVRNEHAKWVRVCRLRRQLDRLNAELARRFRKKETADAAARHPDDAQG